MKRFLFVLAACLVMSIMGTTQASASSFDSLYKNARSYLGVPYKWGGTTSKGFDCSGFTQVVFKNNGTSIPRTTGQQYKTGKAVSKSNLQQGDLVFFNTTGRGVSHVGIFVGNNNFIHASTSRGVMISSINDPYYWGSRYIGARRVKDFSTPPPAPAPVKPDPAIHPTRVEIAVTLTEKLGLQASNPNPTFTDVKDHKESYSISAVQEAGIFTGNDGKFMPNSHLTRAELAVVLVESFGLQGSSGKIFKDVPANHWAKEYIQILAHNGITSGYTNGNFGVNDYVKRTEFEAFLTRLN